MRRTASEIINELEIRVARLEGKTASTKNIKNQINKLKNSFSSVISNLRLEVEKLEERAYFAGSDQEEGSTVHLMSLSNSIGYLSDTQKKVNQELDFIYLKATKVNQVIDSK
jgi:hypothetical protein